ncbi:ABC transporter substrate-binding protein [Prosthecomicrobium sp. N25]|uniref:ABC transporter substrate-binding protein n=1 Tax=Prosthecomicrobium sp. N25 TaxID=3129254 RepID=UPI003077D184
MFRSKILGFAAALAALLLPAVAAAQTPVRVGYIPILGVAPIFIADKEGWLAAAGLKPTFTPFESGPNMIQALASGTVDVYVAGVAPLGVARSKGVDVKVVAATAIEEMTFVAGPRLAKYFEGGAKAAEAFAKFREAEGRPAKLATQPPGSVPDTTLKHWVYKVGGTKESDVQIVAMGIDATQQALLAGAVDGATVREPAVSIITTRNPATRLVALGGDMFPNQPGTVVAVSGAFLAKNPEGVQKMVKAVVDAIDLIAKDPDRTVPHIEAALGKGIVETSIIRKAVASPASKFVADPRVIIEPSRLMQQYQVTIGTLDKEVPLDGLFDTSFYQKATGR